MLHTLRPIELKRSAVTAEGLVTGYASVFDNVDSYGDTVRSGAFAASLAKHRRDGTTVKFLWQHRVDKVLGVWTDLAEDGHGLHVVGRLALDTQLGRETRSLLRSGALNGLSIGYVIEDGGVSYGDGGRELLKIDLWEISAVTFPANRLARIEGAKAAIADPRSFEAALRERLGLSAREAKAAVAAGWRGLSRADQSTDQSTELAALLRAGSESLKRS